MRTTGIETMRAIVHEEYGMPEVLEVRELARPKAGVQDVLVRVHASSANPYDWHLMSGRPYLARLLGRSFGLGVRRPLQNRRGWDVAGVVEEVGAGVRRLQPGDEVFGWGDGAFADYLAVDEDHLVGKPEGVSFERAATVPMAALTALQAVRDQGGTQPGQQVLVNGASGGVGTFAVQLAKWMGAEVTGVCSTRNVEMVRSIGADYVIDYTREDFTVGSKHYDLIIDTAVSRTLAECRRVMTPSGTLVLLGDSGGHWVGGFRRVLQARLVAPFVSQQLRTFTVTPSLDDLELLGALLDSGAITPVIDRSYRLEEAAEALAYLMEGHARGKVVIAVSTERS